MEPVRAEIISTGANLRKGPGMSYAVEDQLAQGDTVQLFGNWNNPAWVKVKVLKTRTGIAVGKEGYIWSTELRLLPPTQDTGPIPMPAPTPAPTPPPVDWGDGRPIEPPRLTNNVFIAVALVVAAVVAVALVYLAR
jgi:hypothetical protein